MWEWFFSYCCAHACQALPLRSELINNTLKNKDGVHFFTLNFECHNRYNKLLLCNFENRDIAWWNKNNSEWVFSVFFEERTKSCFFLKNPKNGFSSIYEWTKDCNHCFIVTTQFPLVLVCRLAFIHTYSFKHLSLFYIEARQKYPYFEPLSDSLAQLLVVIWLKFETKQIADFHIGQKFESVSFF